MDFSMWNIGQAYGHRKHELAWTVVPTYDEQEKKSGSIYCVHLKVM